MRNIAGAEGETEVARPQVGGQIGHHVVERWQPGHGLVGGVVEHGRYDFPSLQSGRYYVGIYNPNAAAVEFRMLIAFQYSLSPLERVTYTSADRGAIIPDDLTSYYSIAVTNGRTVADVKVGVRIDHPRLADLALHLVSPEGTRILLTENRGLSLGTNYGEGVPKDFIVPFNSAGHDQ